MSRQKFAFYFSAVVSIVSQVILMIFASVFSMLTVVEYGVSGASTSILFVVIMGIVWGAIDMGLYHDLPVL